MCGQGYSTSLDSQTFFLFTLLLNRSVLGSESLQARASTLEAAAGPQVFYLPQPLKK